MEPIWFLNKALGIMSADQIAEIAPLIREVLGAPSKVTLCATFEVTGNSDAWAQVTATAINIAYPSEQEPQERLAALLSSSTCTGISDWEPMKFVTLTYGPDRPQAIARLIDGLLSELFQLNDYSVDASIEEL